MAKKKHDDVVLEKCPTGIKGLDEITKGGLPKGRPTLICGSAGCGKTLFSMEFLMRGAMDYKEPGVFMTFEETPDDLAKNFMSLGFDLKDMVSQGLIATDHVYVERSEIEGRVITTWKKGSSSAWAAPLIPSEQKRVVLDTIEALFSGLSNAAIIIRAELEKAFSLVERTRRNRYRYGGKRRQDPDALRTRRIRRRLRDPPLTSALSSKFPPVACVLSLPRLISRRRRVSFPD